MRSTGRLPQGWTSAAIGDLVDARVEQATPQHGTPVTYVDISSIDNERKEIAEPSRVEGASAPTRARQWLQPGDVLVSMTRPNLNAVAIVPPNLAGAVGSTGFDVLRTQCIEPRWIYFAVQTREFIDDMCSHIQGVVYPAVRPRDVRSFVVPIPPLAEQRRIVEALDAQFTRLDAALATLERVRVGLERYRAAVLQAAVDGRLTGPGIAVNGVLQRDWRELSIGQLATVGTGATPKRGTSRYYDQGTIAWVTSGALNERNVREATEFVTDAALEETNLTVYPPGTLLVAMYGEGKTRGKCAVLSLSATTNQAIAAIQLRPEYAGYEGWLQLVLEQQYAKTRRLATGGVQPNLNLSLVRGIRVPLPPLPEAAAIVSESSRLQSVLDSVEEQVLAMEGRINGLRQSLLRVAFEGRLVPQDPRDEPASVLLDRIRASRAATPPTRKRTSPRSSR